MMGLLSVKCLCSSKPGNMFPVNAPFGRKIDFCSSPNVLQSKLGSGFRSNTRVFAHKRRNRKSRNPKPHPHKRPSDGNNKVSDTSLTKDGSVKDNSIVPPLDNKFVDVPLTEDASAQDDSILPPLEIKFVNESLAEDDSVQGNSIVPPLDNKLVDVSPKKNDSVKKKNATPSLDSLGSRTLISVSSRSSVLQACTITSGLIAGLGVLVRQVSHFASTEGWPVIDCSSEISFSFEMWHLEVITGLVILISSSRFVLLKIWPDFAESSEAANQQVLTNLQPLDYLVVACLPGFSEELLFRGALFPLFGNEWKSALGVSLLFGFLHLGSGRKYSFAIWATFVGLAYAYATVLSSSIVVPMVSHAMNNLVGGALWRYTSKPTK